MFGFYESANSEGLESQNSILVRRIEMGTLSLKKLAVCDVSFVRDRERLICTNEPLPDKGSGLEYETNHRTS